MILQVSMDNLFVGSDWEHISACIDIMTCIISTSTDRDSADMIALDLTFNVIYS